MQSKKSSAVEMAVQVGVKGVTATLLWIAIRPYALDIPAVCVTLIFMVNSFALGYVIRRSFNRGVKA